MKKYKSQDELTREEKAKRLADIIMMMLPMFHVIDLEFAKEAHKSMLEDANRMDSMAVLNPRYDPDKPNLLRQKANSLQAIIDFIESNKVIGELNKKIGETEDHYKEIEKLFQV